MKTDFKFSNLCGTVYTRGNMIFCDDVLLSPVGNRISCYDLVKNKSQTLSFENRKDIARICLSPRKNLLISVDVDGHALLINYQQKVLLHKHHFKEPVYDIQFSPNGKYIAVTHGNHVQLWNAPGFTLEFQPFVLHKTYPGHYDLVTAISWSRDSKYFLTSSKDMTSRLYAVSSEDFQGACLTGHSNAVIGAWFSNNAKSVYTVSKDGALFEWQLQGGEWSELQDFTQIPRKKTRGIDEKKPILKWKAKQKHYFNQNHAKITCAAFSPDNGILSVGFDSGIFGIWELPDFTNIHTLSISRNKITTVAMNSTGEWLAFGSAKLGQLLVWEWQSESYVLKQQGHHNDMTCIDYSMDGQYLATGGDDGKVKVWSSQSGFCFVTFSDHTAPVRAIEFAKRKQIVFSASLDGTVRAYDMIRYRNFKTFTSPTPEQFATIAVDLSVEIVCAASQDNFEIYMWSVQTGKLLEIMAGHEAPVSAMAFSPASGILASGSWDKTVRTWDLFGRDKAVDTMLHTSEVLTLAFSPNGEILASCTLDGNINMWNMDTSKLFATIEGKRDIVGGRSSRDKVKLDRTASGKYFTSICFTGDGKYLLAGGNSKYVCLYDVSSTTLVKRFQISSNLSLDRMQEMLNSKNMTEAGPIDLIDMDGELSDLEDRIDRTLPGVQTGDRSAIAKRPSARTNSVKMSPTGRAWAAASTEGLLIYSTDESLHFDPFDLDMDVTPESILKYLKQKSYTKSLIAAFRLGEQEYIDKVYNQIPYSEVTLVLQDLGISYFERFLKLLNRQLEHSPRLEFHMFWLVSFLKKNGHYLKDNIGEFKPILRSLHKWISRVNNDVLSICQDNINTLGYVTTSLKKEPKLEVQDVNMELLGL